ncbi:hypothetical protein LCGC14_1952940, partial [marine sediment metagenome]
TSFGSKIVFTTILVSIALHFAEVSTNMFIFY